MGKAAWLEPLETRSIHFYVNRCGFHIVEFFNSCHPDPNNPAVLLADEPTAGLDAENAGAVHALLREAADDGAAVLLVTHEQGAEEYADRVLHMDGGRLSG